MYCLSDALFFQMGTTVGTGHLINEAFEVAEAAAELHAGGRVALRTLTGFRFLAAPSLGGLVRFTAQLRVRRGLSCRPAFRAASCVGNM